MADDGRDAPFCLVYLVNDGTQTARLAAASGVERGQSCGARRIPLDQPGSARGHCERCSHSRDVEVVTGLRARASPCPGGRGRKRVDCGIDCPVRDGTG